MRIKLERSGGFAGIYSSNELNSDELPPKLLNTIREYLDKKSDARSYSRVPRGAADHFNYKITIKDGTHERVIDCNDYDTDHKLKSLITYIERNTKKRKGDGQINTS